MSLSIPTLTEPKFRFKRPKTDVKMKTILFLLVMYKGDTRYLVQEYDTVAACRRELALATTEFQSHKDIKILRLECIQTGVSL